MHRTDAEAYSSLILSSLSFQRGQSLYIKADPAHWSFAVALAQGAYDNGAKYVEVDAQHALLHRARVEHSAAEYLTYVPPTRAAAQQLRLDEEWALVSMKSPDDPNSLNGMDAARNGIVQKALAQVDFPYRAKVQGDGLRWIVVSVPTPRWAAHIYGGDPDASAEERLWSQMKPILRLDQPDPIAAWEERKRVLRDRREALNALSLDSIRFSGPGTDLTVGLTERSIWAGGSSVAADGHEFLPNLPTEEVFTTPDFRRTSGRVAMTRPVQVLGSLVTNGWMEFESGRLVRCGADSGAEMLERYFEIDERARYLGELALVDTASPVFQSGLIFSNILYDENAACHIALGSSYRKCMRDGLSLSDEEYLEAGGNISTLHTDFMIGGPEVEVEGRRRDGSVVSIIQDGSFSV